MAVCAAGRALDEAEARFTVPVPRMEREVATSTEQQGIQPSEEVMEKILQQARELSRDVPRCPLCGEQLAQRNAELVCESVVCRGRIVEGCCGQ